MLARPALRTVRVLVPSFKPVNPARFDGVASKSQHLNHQQRPIDAHNGYPHDSWKHRPSIATLGSSRSFSTTSDKKAKNRVYTSVRRPDELESYILSSTSSRIPLITLWTASYCASCKTVLPKITELISAGVGEPATTSVNFCEVEFDSQDMMDSDMGMRYMVTALPTLVSFDRGEVMTGTKTTDVHKLKDEKFLRAWIEKEAERTGSGSGGGSGGGLFGGLFGSLRK